VVRYRKSIVQDNLRKSFPEKTNLELKKIEKKFYKHMCDMFLEMIKTISISENQLRKRFVCENIEVLHKYEKECPGIILMCGHYASYEWATAINFYDMKNKGYAIYKKLRSPMFDDLIKSIRANLGTTLINSKEAIPKMMRNKRDDVKSTYYMIADQSPKKANAAVGHWINFMGRETPAFTGSEAMGKKLGFGILYLEVKKVKRGYYSAKLIPLSQHPKEREDFTITDQFFQRLEKQIQEEPAYYLWTHKRWKHKRD
jgi:KDO2-lipid IV(A) lauroyltransferase